MTEAPVYYANKNPTIGDIGWRVRHERFGIKTWLKFTSNIYVNEADAKEEFEKLQTYPKNKYRRIGIGQYEFRSTAGSPDGKFMPTKGGGA